MRWIRRCQSCYYRCCIRYPNEGHLQSHASAALEYRNLPTPVLVSRISPIPGPLISGEQHKLQVTCREWNLFINVRATISAAFPLLLKIFFWGVERALEVAKHSVVTWSGRCSRADRNSCFAIWSSDTERNGRVCLTTRFVRKHGQGSITW